MKKELTLQILEKYPLIFPNTAESPKENLVPFFGFECGDGWYNIIDRLCGCIQNHIKSCGEHREWALKHNKRIDEDPNYLDWNKKPYTKKDVPEIVTQVVVTQIKEKFGGLRFYYTGGDDVVDGMVQLAENISYVTCEECGNTGKTRNGGWIRTLCDEHHTKRGLGATDEFLP